MKNKLTLFILALTLLICIMPFSLAADYLPHKQNTNFELIISSNNASTCNWTYIQYPDGSKSSNQYLMTKQGTDFNITIDAGNFSQLGSTCMGITCYDGSQYEGGSVCREVTTAGIMQTTSQGIGSAIYLVLMIVLTFIFGGVGLKLSQSKTWKILGIFLVFFSVLLLVYDVWLGSEYYITFTGLSNSAMPQTIFYIFMFILVAGLFVSCALLFIRWKEVFRWFKKQLKKKEDTNDEDIEDWDLSKFAGSGLK